MSEVHDIPPALPPKVTARRSFPGARSVIALVLREMSTTYGKSAGGYAWAILEPVVAIIFLSMVFGIVMRSPALGNSFPMFYATGVLTFGMFTGVQGKVSQALLYSKALLSYPTVTFIDAILARLILTVITEVLVCYIVFTGAMIFAEGWMRIDLPTIALGLFLAVYLGLGIGVLNAFIIMKIPLWQMLWSVLMRPMFILSGVIFLYDVLREPYSDWLWWNPAVHVIGLVRRGFYEAYQAQYVSVTYVMLVATISLTLGLLFLRAHYRDMLANN